MLRMADSVLAVEAEVLEPTFLLANLSQLVTVPGKASESNLFETSFEIRTLLSAM